MKIILGTAILLGVIAVIGLLAGITDLQNMYAVLCMARLMALIVFIPATIVWFLSEYGDSDRYNERLPAFWPIIIPAILATYFFDWLRLLLGKDSILAMVIGCVYLLFAYYMIHAIKNVIMNNKNKVGP